jgi:hypothetical protein
MRSAGLHPANLPVATAAAGNGIMIAAMLAVSCPFDDGHLLVIAVVSMAVMLAATGRRPQVNREEAVYCAQCGKRLSEK